MGFNVVVVVEVVDNKVVEVVVFCVLSVVLDDLIISSNVGSMVVSVSAAVSSVDWDCNIDAQERIKIDGMTHIFGKLIQPYKKSILKK